MPVTARGLSPSARGRGATCQLRPPTPSQRRVARAAQVRRRSLSLGRRRSTRACFARAPCRAGCDRFVSHRKAAPARGLSPSARGRGVTCQLRPPTSSQRRVCRAAQARRRSLSLGWRRSTRACCACAPCRAGCGRSMRYQRALRRREASLLPARAVVRRASCGLQRQASAAWLARRRRGGARCLWGGGAALELAARAPCRAGCGRSVPCQKGRCAGERPLSFVARRGATCQLQPPSQASAACLARRGASALAVSGKEAQHSSLAARAPCRAGCGLLASYQRALRRREASLLRRAPWCDVPAAASNAKPAPRGSRGAGAPALAVSGEETQHSSLLRARAVPRWL